MDLLQVNETGRMENYRPTKSCMELTDHELYEILEFKQISGGFGNCVVVVLKDMEVFLPKRVAKEVFPNVEALNNDPQKWGLRKVGEFLDESIKKKHLAKTALVEFVNINKFIMERKELVNELHKPARKNYPRRNVVIKGIDDLWQADLVEMIPYAKYNKNYKYLLTVIDTFSKYSWVEPIKNKNAFSVTQAMEKIFTKSKRTPKHLQTDMGSEFYNKDFQSLMMKRGILHYSSYSVLKASIVERFNRTLKEHMFRKFSMRGTFRYVDLLDDLVNDYNNTKHRTIKMSPADVNNSNEESILRTVYNRSEKSIKKPKFKVGDYVRISKYKRLFEKSYTPNWTTEIFCVTHVNYKHPITYLLKDYREQPIAGRFYQEELQKTKYPDVYLVEKVLQRKGNQLLVKYLGFSSSHNSWINKNDLV